MNLSILAFLSLALAVTGEGISPADQGTIRRRKLTAHEVGVALIERTHLPQEKLGDGGAVEADYEDAEGRIYHVTSTVAITTANRIRIHDDGKEEVVSVQCTPAGSPTDLADVVLTLAEPIEQGDLDDIFPEKSLVIIEGEDYGHCDLGFGMDEGTLGKIEEISDDAYLMLDKAELSNNGKTVTLHGYSSNFFAQFEEIKLDVKLVGDRRRELEHIAERRRELGIDEHDDDTASHRKLESAASQMRKANADAAEAMKNSKITGVSTATDCGEGQSKFTQEFQLEKFCAHATAETCMNSADSGITQLHIRAGVKWFMRPYFDIQIETTTDFKAEAAVQIGFLDCEKEASEEIEITPQVMLMRLDIHAVLVALDFFGGMEVPKYGIGVYAQLIYVVEAKMTLKNAPSITAGVGYDMGREVKQYRVAMEPGTYQVTNEETLVDYRAGRGFYTIFEREGARMELDATVFMGIRPVIGMYTKTFMIEAKFDFGVFGELKFRGPEAPMLDEKESCLVDSACSDLCQSKHYNRVGVSLQAKDMKVNTTLFMDFFSSWTWDDIKWSKEFTILDGPFLDVPLGMLCFGANDKIAEGRGDAAAVSRSFETISYDMSDFEPSNSPDFEKNDGTDEYENVLDELNKLRKELNMLKKKNEIYINSENEDYRL
jgi:hypothetical protein